MVMGTLGERTAAVSLIWGPGPALVMGLGNPNPTTWTSPFSGLRSPGLLGALDGLAGPYSTTLNYAPVVAAESLWTGVSARWLEVLSFQPPPVEQIPMAELLESLQTQYPVYGVGLGYSGQNASVNLLHGLDRARVRHLFTDIRRQLAHGWLSPRDLRLLIHAVRQRPS
jgi:hypothetical protein